MSRQRFWLLLIAAIVVLSGALYLSGQRNRSRQTAGAPLLPSLGQQLNAVSAVTLRKGAATPTSTLHQTHGVWTVAERADYPADVGKLRKLLTQLRDATIVEEKTADPASYAIIGVADPATGGSVSTEITVVAPGQKYAVIVGKPAGEGSFVRRSGEARSFSVEPAITVDADPRTWIEPRLLNVGSDSIQSIEFKPDSGAGYAVRRAKAPDAKAPDAKTPDGKAPDGKTPDGKAPDVSFTLEGAPAIRKPLDGAALAPERTLLADLDAVDVAPAAAVDFSHAARAIVTLNDGTVISLTGAVAGDKHWLQLTSSKDAALTAKAAGRAFEVAAYRYDALFKPLDQMLVPLPAPAPRKSAPTGRQPATP